MKTILIVDDSPTVRNYHASIVKTGGYEIVTAVDGAEALEKLYQNDVSFVLTDLNMEGMDGYEFTRRVRLDEKYRDLPIMIVTTEAANTDKSKGYEAGATLYLVKPCEPDEILEHIKLLIEA